MSLPLRIDAADPTPPYEQLRRQIAFAITSGTLPTDTRLPTVRQLAGDLGVAPGTVMRTYAELESAGLVVSRRGAGTLVAAVPVRTTDRLDALARDYVTASRAIGADDDAILAAARGALTAQ